MSYRKAPVNVFWHVIILCRGVSLPPISGAWEIQEVIMPRRKVESKARLWGMSSSMTREKKNASASSISLERFNVDVPHPDVHAPLHCNRTDGFFSTYRHMAREAPSVLPSTCLNTDRAVRGSALAHRTLLFPTHIRHTALFRSRSIANQNERHIFL